MKAGMTGLWAWLVGLGAACLGGCALSNVRAGDTASPVILYVAPRVRTLDPSQPFVQALAVSRGKIIDVGLREALISRHRPARIVEWKNGTLVPGIHDSHGHLNALGASLALVRLNGAKGLNEIVERLKSAPPESHQGDWLMGRGWDQNEWPELGGKFPNSQALDDAFGQTPVFLTRVDGHAAWVNKAALQRVGITPDTRDPAGGRIVRDARGLPTGVLVDNAMDLVTAKLPALSDEQFEARLKSALSHCVALGLSAVHDAGMDPRTFQVLEHWDFAGTLPIRVFAMADGWGPGWEQFLDRGPFQGRNLSLRTVKLLADGALGSRGAALHAPYSDDPKQSGLWLLEPEVLRARARAFMERGFQVAIHAIGDKANTVVLDILSEEGKATQTVDLRHRVEHAQILREEDIPRFARDKIIASMQPTHATSDMAWAGSRLGQQRVKGGYVWRRLLDSGAALAFGSDFPIEGANPLAGIYAARTRQDGKGQPEGGWMPEERLTGAQALKAFTQGAAFAVRSETQLGMLKAGFDADFTVFDVDPVDGAPEELLGAKAIGLVVAGQERVTVTPVSD
jgi:predicted amidohydrolase YtcJ